METQKSLDRLQHNLQAVRALLEKQRVVETMIHKQDVRKHDLVESLVHRQHLVELQTRLNRLHSADIAHIIEALPPEDRLLLWQQITSKRLGDILLEVSDTVRTSLVKITDPELLLNALKALNADDLAYIADDIPPEIMQQRLLSLTSKDKDWLQSSLSYREDQVGALMGSEWVSVRETETLEQVLQHLRGLSEFPAHNDKLFVIDRRGILTGVISLQTLLLSDPVKNVIDVMAHDVVRFVPDDDAGDAAKAFERYDLISAPVVNPRGKIIGRLTVDTVMDYIREESTEEVLGMAGLRGGEDLFAPVLHSARNRAMWLSINLITAFISSRIIGIFEGSISQLVALAALMPIVATVGGNTGNQTIALMIRGITLGQITPGNVRYLVRKELIISVLNGLTMGCLVGVFAYLLYGNLDLGLVITAAMLITLVIAALIGLAYPLLLQKLGRDPALGSSILLTATTDSMGFLVFLGLATVFLLH